MGPTVTFQIVGDAFVDLFSFLEHWPEKGGDSRLVQPIQSYAGGSSVNTTTHLTALCRDFVSQDDRPEVILHTVLNPNDDFGKILVKHATDHNFPLVNCRSESSATSSTGHCIVIVAEGDRSFMTHQGCVEEFSASDIDSEKIIETDGPVHVHVAGFFNLKGFWNGNLSDQLLFIRKERRERYPDRETMISMVPQFDATNEWDGGLDELIPCLDFLIMNELESNRILQRGLAVAHSSDDTKYLQELIAFFSPLNSKACFVVTRGANGAVAFRNGGLLAAVGPAIAVNVVDTTGAGDGFAAGFLHGLWEWKREHGEATIDEWSAEAVMRGLVWGCASGTAVVRIRGASIPANPQDIESMYEELLQQNYDTYSSS